MDEQALVRIWNDKRSQIIMAQLAPAIVLISIFVLASQGTFTNASSSAKYLSIAIAAMTGLLAMISQYAAIREGQSLIQDLQKIKSPSAISQKIIDSYDYLNVMLFVVLSFGVAAFSLVVWSILG